MFHPFREPKLSQLLGKRISTMGRERLEKSLESELLTNISKLKKRLAKYPNQMKALGCREKESIGKHFFYKV